MNGKGSRPRPKIIPLDKWAENHERIFKKGKQTMTDTTANTTDNLTDTAEQFDAEQFDAVLLRAHDVQIRDDVAWFSDKEGRLFETMPHTVYSKLMREHNERGRKREAMNDATPTTTKKHTLVVLDTETGGLDWRKHSIIEIAAWVIEIEKTEDRGLAFRYGERFEMKCKPDRPVDPGAAEINGYNEADWTSALSLRDALHAFFSWLAGVAPKGAMWCGSNPDFDLRFLESAAERCELSMPDHMSHRMCNLASLCFPLMLFGTTEGIGLRHLRKWADLEGEQKHRAMADVEDTMAVLQKYLVQLEDADSVRALADLERPSL